MSFAGHVAPFLVKRCGACHNAKNPQAGVNVDVLKNPTSMKEKRAVWEQVLHSLQSERMPPKNAPAIPRAERASVLGYLEQRLAGVDCELKDPGRVTMRRLNRVEYNNTVRDLLGVDLQPANDFPSDDVGYGFDNIGDVLTLSPLLMEKYLSAAERLARAAVPAAGDRSGPGRRYEAERLNETRGEGVVGRGHRLLFSLGAVTAEHAFPKAGDYLIRIRAFEQPAGQERAQLALQLDGRELQRFEVAATENSPAVYEARAAATAGRHVIGAAFLNDFYDRRSQDPRNRDRNLGIDYIEIVGPLPRAGEGLPESYRAFFRPAGCPAEHPHTWECGKKAIAAFLPRAYRRPTNPTEVERVHRILDLAKQEGDSLETGVQLAIQATLNSPHFLFRVEVDPAPNDARARREVNDWELASRLSYFLWSTMPDEPLFALARQKKLRDPAVLAAQAQRMLKDRRSLALVDGFVEQWLTLRNLANFAPDPRLFPAFTPQLRADMLTEVRLFAAEIFRDDRSLLEFLDADFTYVNERLAKHYGLAGVSGPEFRRVNLQDRNRGGVLAMAAVLSVTSNPTRTSPVKRGKWVLEQIMGTPPPPALEGAPPLKEETGQMLTGTLRQRMEQHRQDPLCASCHTEMDAIGFGLENFDAIGGWRTQEGPYAIDSSGELPGGERFTGPAQLKALLMRQKDQYLRSFCEKLLTYALGRGVERSDRCHVDTVVRQATRGVPKLSVVVSEIVKSDPFLLRRGDRGGDE